MQRKYILMLLSIAYAVGCVHVSAEMGLIDDTSNPAEALWESQQKKMEMQYQQNKTGLENNWLDQQKKMDAKWDRYLKEQTEKEARFKAEVEQKWLDFRSATAKQWVEYNPAKDALSHVDFEAGKITLEVVVEESDTAAVETVASKLEEASVAMITQKDATNTEVLRSQIADKKGNLVNSDNVRQYLRAEVLSKVTADPVAYNARDGIRRRRYSVQIAMVPNHLKIRAQKYLPIVEKNAKRFKLKPELVMAVIHTESNFNPKAKSPVNAIGIMQILPRFAGRDAYREVYGEDKIITQEYLYNPENNIELGCAYLNLLKSRHFRNIKDDVKRRHVTICAYNCGPTFMRKRIVNKYPIGNMTEREVYTLLKKKTPAETRNYIDKVTERMSLYTL